jgi:hypothetical protein
MENLSLTDRRPNFKDLAGQRLLMPTDPVQRLARPKVQLMAAEFVERGGRMFIAGRIKNLSEFPSCTKIMAQAVSEDASIVLEQHKGKIGAHRLLPGEASAFRIDFEGYLKIQDQAFNAAYNPEQFSVPELTELPSKLSLALSTTVCAPAYYKSLIFEDMSTSGSEEEQVLTARVTNFGTEIVSTLQLKLSYLDDDKRLIWVDSFHLQNNLIPGEERVITIPLSTMPKRSSIPINAITINGKADRVAAASIWSSGAALPSGAGQILVDYDAMIYRPLD